MSRVARLARQPFSLERPYEPKAQFGQLVTSQRRSAHQSCRYQQHPEETDPGWIFAQ